MYFEYDSAKSQSNYEKHGIDFEEAKDLWLDEYHIEIPAKNIDEPRYMVIGKIDKQHWSAIITYRDSIIRLISVRRSRETEVNFYETY